MTQLALPPICKFRPFSQEYLLADKNMSVAPVAFSLMASFMSAITLLGVSSENYTYGAQFIVINVAYALATPVAAHLYLPVFFRLQATSAYEVEHRVRPKNRSDQSHCSTSKNASEVQLAWPRRWLTPSR